MKTVLIKLRRAICGPRSRFAFTRFRQLVAIHFLQIQIVKICSFKPKRNKEEMKKKLKPASTCHIGARNSD
jgi:hypothetical protein